jgi:hypothetical protein
VGQQVWKSCCTCCRIYSDFEVVADCLGRTGGWGYQ